MLNHPLIHPITGLVTFGRVPEAKSGIHRIEPGEIHLRVGKHTGPNRGFGAAHIWAEHQKEMAQRGFFTEQEVPSYVAAIICVGTPLYFTAGNMRNPRLLAVRAVTGMAVLEQRYLNEAVVWSVVTAYSGNKKGGSRVGVVL